MKHTKAAATPAAVVTLPALMSAEGMLRTAKQQACLYSTLGKVAPAQCRTLQQPAAAAAEAMAAARHLPLL
jgi:hypothetical protein